MWICNRLAPCDPSALLADKTASFRKKTCRLALPLIMRQKIVDLSKTLIFFTYLWVRKWCFESLRSMNFTSNPSCIWPHWCDWNWKIVYQPQIWLPARKPRKAPLQPIKVKNEILFWKSPHSLSHDEGDYQTPWLFSQRGPFGCQRRTWPHGADSPHLHTHIEASVNFFKP